MKVKLLFISLLLILVMSTTTGAQQPAQVEQPTIIIRESTLTSSGVAYKGFVTDTRPDKPDLFISHVKARQINTRPIETKNLLMSP